MYLRFRVGLSGILLLFLLTASTVRSQDIRVNYLGIEDGLSNNAVTSICQDHNGFMWFGTYDGLNRYDGYGFKVFRNIIGDSTSISSNGINALDEDALHRLWVCGQKEVNIYNPVTAKFIKPSYTFANNSTSSSLKDNVVAVKTVNGTKVLVGTQHDGLFYFENAFNGRQITLDGKVNYYVEAIDFDKTKNIAYIFIGDHGLFTYDLKTKALHLETDAVKDRLFRKCNCYWSR